MTDAKHASDPSAGAPAEPEATPTPPSTMAPAMDASPTSTATATLDRRIHSDDDDDDRIVPVEKSAQPVTHRADLFDEDEYSLDEYEELLDMYEESIKDVQEGQIVAGHILRVDENVVVLDVGFKSEGVVPLDEFKPTDSLEVGAQVDVYLENLEDQEGRVVLSKKKADFFKVWDKIRIAYDNGKIVLGRIARNIK